MNTMNTLNMNTLTIVALAYWALAALWAGFRGMIRTVLAFLVIVLTVFVTYTATPVVYQSLHGSANVNNYLQKQSGTVIENLANGIASGTDSTGWMEILPLPEEAQQVIALGDHALIAQMLTQEPTKSTLAIQLANIITRILSTILTAVSVFIILTIIRFILLRIADLPGISALDHFLGFVIGIIKGVVVIWIGLLIIRLIALTGNGTQLVRQVNESEILTILDNYNMVRRLVMSLIAGL
jgi:uncharacterized membrane protein required for colicin V production